MKRVVFFILLLRVVASIDDEDDNDSECDPDDDKCDEDINEKNLIRFPFFRRVFKRIPDIIERWKYYRQLFKMRFRKGEIAKRFKIFSNNYLFIVNKNDENLTFVTDMNVFGFMTREEYFHLLSTTIAVKFGASNESLSQQDTDSDHESIKKYNIPSKKDWRESGVVTPVKNQYTCGSCYAFATVGALESARAIKGGKLTRLSEQSVVDCSLPYGNMGCNGGALQYTFQYLSTRPISEESSYPYINQVGQCKLSSYPNTPQISQFVRIPRGDENALAEAIGNKGPVAIAVDARLDSFRFYKKGVYNDPSCSSTQLNHGVLAVGIVSSPSPAYIIKNSWGTSWGENGYIFISRDQGNRCGVTTDAVYPVI